MASLFIFLLQLVRWVGLRVCAPLAVLVALICVSLYMFQDKLVFFPKAVSGYDTPEHNPPGWRNPGEHNIDYEDVYLATPDSVSIHMWLMKQPNSAEVPTILFFQGNAGNMGFRLANLVQLFRSLKVNVAAMSYRGYGYSSGFPGEEGVLIDAQTAVDYLVKRQDLDTKRIVLFGRSLGGAVAVHTGVKNANKVKCVIVENTFWDINEMALQLLVPFKLFPSALKMLLRVKFESGIVIKKMSIPMLFLSGTEDTLVPPIQMDRLFEACGSPFKWLVKIHDGTHNDSWQLHPEAYYKTLRKFLENVESTAPKTASEMTIQVGEPKEKSKLTAEVRPRAPRFYESALRQLNKCEIPAVGKDE